MLIVACARCWHVATKMHVQAESYTRRTVQEILVPVVPTAVVLNSSSVPPQGSLKSGRLATS